VGRTRVWEGKLRRSRKSTISIERSLSQLPSFSLHQGTTTDGKTFEGFLGGDCFEKKVMSKFDDFLHESFGEWMLVVGV
jgi:hypothetical protein